MRERTSPQLEYLKGLSRTMWLFFIFVAVPIIEIALFIQVGGWLGLFPTLAIVIITAALGTYLVRSQAIETFASVKQQFTSLRDPSEPLAHAAMIIFAGALLLTPGFFTDTVGFLLLVPSLRANIFSQIKARASKAQSANRAHFSYHQSSYRERDKGPTIIEGEYSVRNNDNDNASR